MSKIVSLEHRPRWKASIRSWSRSSPGDAEPAGGRHLDDLSGGEPVRRGRLPAGVARCGRQPDRRADVFAILLAVLLATCLLFVPFYVGTRLSLEPTMRTSTCSSSRRFRRGPSSAENMPPPWP